ncbi:MAG: hypothetical protein US57_C0002G0052 [Candidatus Moranbacteria bacterium GW2011_GWC2_37_73]|nr:MAG: hypothetical protein UR95_C0002G0150 [Parcubacteria group bacterium GW2011_GWC1_36_108]KKQ01007.1 MAG: hypothetical protein US09_C0003G0007 [Candidatus Moranbacteria bacterium GW2011_GWD1_36_198]KKQ02409.1 MAG: hypothetical protein US10_C0001G0007 [Candidatus Moranbacteria bacterium GW2011_GWD2_36_198]KKQ40345.1 MAG: hypothetical protein US57_C0002G0052 [Candidatus Moranbacteria bacterium GW2011_GWC2_37_73]HAS00147.1 hypothetical protein [Candidatus Moranbacteria bacterium]
MLFQEKKTETSYKNNKNDVILYRDLNKREEIVSPSFAVEKKRHKKILKIFFIDHFHLLFKSAALNHLRIQECKSKSKVGDVCNFNFDSYSQLKRYQKKVRLFTFSTSFTAALIFVAVASFQFLNIQQGKSATFGWLQTDWSGGIDAVATAIHTSNQNGWIKFFSKDDDVDTSSGEIKISSTTDSFVTTSDTDFNAFAKTQSFVSGAGSAGTIYAQKPDGGSCTTNTECVNNWCNVNVCANPWTVGPCAGFAVYKEDSGDPAHPGTWQWKTSDTDCAAPQCLPVDGFDGLVADNNVDFSLYPSRNACKAIGGRLPTRNELLCIYSNKASYGMASATGLYNTSQEAAVNKILTVRFSDGFSNVAGAWYKTSWWLNRCVK